MINTNQYASLTKDEVIKQILENHNLYIKESLDELTSAMEEAFREGFLRGEEYATN